MARESGPDWLVSSLGRFPQGVIIASKVFVGNLSYDTSQAGLEALFAQAGEVVEVYLPIDQATGRLRGFAFVEFGDAASVPDAIAKFDGTELDGRVLKVNEARDRPPRAPGGFRPDMPPPGRGSRPKGSRRGLRGRKRGF